MFVCKIPADGQETAPSRIFNHLSGAIQGGPSVGVCSAACGALGAAIMKAAHHPGYDTWVGAKEGFVGSTVLAGATGLVLGARALNEGGIGGLVAGTIVGVILGMLTGSAILKDAGLDHLSLKKSAISGAVGCATIGAGVLSVVLVVAAAAAAIGCCVCCSKLPKLIRGWRDPSSGHV